MQCTCTWNLKNYNVIQKYMYMYVYIVVVDNDYCCISFY